MENRIARRRRFRVLRRLCINHIMFMRSELLKISIRDRTFTRSFINNDVVQILNGDEVKCRQHCRLSQRSLLRLTDLMNGKLFGWNIRLETVVFLMWMASASYLRIIHLCTGIPISTVHTIVKKYLSFFVENLGYFVKFPDENELINIGLGFARRGRSNIFAKAAGAIDGTYIKVRCPVALHDQYINRKLQYAIQLQAVCDHTGKFIDVFAGYPGSVHDQRVLISSPLYTQGAYPPEDYFLLGDSGYALTLDPIKIIVPYKERPNQPLPFDKRRFNNQHSRARTIIESAFGMLKLRWRYLFRTSELKIKTTVKVIGACCAVHNVCCAENDLFVVPDNELQTETPGNDDDLHHSASPNAVAFRDRMCRLLNEESRISSSRANE